MSRDRDDSVRVRSPITSSSRIRNDENAFNQKPNFKTCNRSLSGICAVGCVVVAADDDDDDGATGTLEAVDDDSDDDNDGDVSASAVEALSVSDDDDDDDVTPPCDMSMSCCFRCSVDNKVDVKTMNIRTITT